MQKTKTSLRQCFFRHCRIKTTTYNANGIRTSKTINGVKHTYTLDGTKILKEEWAGNVLIPLYDNEDAVCGIIYNDTPYYFEKNLQGDVISIVDANSALVARYTYDAWGVCTHIVDANGIDIIGNASHIANINPFRYRGYYYDSEIQMYYLKTRYYSPGVGRFINADTVFAIGYNDTNISCNIYQYCDNSPTVGIDREGKWLLRLVCGIAGGAIFGTFAYFIADLFGASGKLKAGITAGFAAVGAALGATFGPKALVNAFTKMKPWFKEMRKKTKIIKYNPSNPENLGGFVLFGVIKVMLHLPHLKNPYNPHKYLHLQIEFGSLKFRIPLGKKK